MTAIRRRPVPRRSSAPATCAVPRSTSASLGFVLDGFPTRTTAPPATSRARRTRVRDPVRVPRPGQVLRVPVAVFAGLDPGHPVKHQPRGPFAPRFAPQLPRQGPGGVFENEVVRRLRAADFRLPPWSPDKSCVHVTAEDRRGAGQRRRRLVLREGERPASVLVAEGGGLAGPRGRRGGGGSGTGCR